MEIKNVAVFCGASALAEAKYRKLATECGKLIAEFNLGLVYGGGDSGLMGDVARSTQKHGGVVTGVYPKIINDREPLKKDMDHTYIVDTMSERKIDMTKMSQAFIILPGGFGTLDELFEVITLKYLGIDRKKPIIIVNYDGYWDKLSDLMNHFIETKFAPAKVLDTFTFVTTLEDGFAKLGFRK